MKKKRKRAPLALRKDLTKLFAQHKWPGGRPAALIQSAGASASGCPDGTTPHDITYQLPDGTWAVKTVCL